MSRPQPKADPESLALRAAPARVVRFRRGIIVALGASAAVGIAVLSWLALEPPSLRLASERGPSPASQAAPEVLAGAPSSYADVPRLGAPLPGDLGRPILARQRELEQRGDDPARNAVQEAEAARQRVAAERLAARQSSVMMRLTGSRLSPASGIEVPPPDAPPAVLSLAADAAPPRISEQVGRSLDEEVVSAHRRMPPASPQVLSAGSIIAASLITGLNSDLPGFVTALVTQQVFDSATGTTLLIPQGSRLVGRYDNVVAFGQSRALVIWQRIILPDGSSIRIDNLPATDMQGYAGLSDRIDRHTWTLLKGVVLSTLLGVGTELSFGSDERDLVRALRESAQQSGARAGDQLVTRSLDVQPTLRVRPGWPLRVILHKDIVLPPWTDR